MSQITIDLTLPVILQEIDYVLEDYPEYPYQVAFSLEKLRQKLIAYVLSQVPNRYTVVENTQEPRPDSNCLHLPLPQRLHIGMVIRGGILHLLRENADWVSRHIPPKEN